MTDQELINQQNKLQERAHLIIDELNLFTLLSTFGQTYIVGSVLHGLMTWPDIDIEAHVSEYSIDDLLQVAKKLIKHKQVVDITLRDYRHDTNPNKPKGLYLGCQYEYSGERWKIDIWLLKPQHKQTLDIAPQLENLTPEQKISILRIKNAFWNDHRYRKSITSIDIYNAVLYHNIESVDGFNSYINQKLHD